MAAPPSATPRLWLPQRHSCAQLRRSPLRMRAGRPRCRTGPGRWTTGRPFPSDDRVELRTHQLLVGIHKVEELLVHALRRVDLTGRDGGHDPCHRGCQALMACRPSFLLLISILRGLACSATGIFRVRTPLS